MSKYRATQLGVWLEIIMFKEHMSQGDLAKKIGCSQSLISCIVRGQYNHLRNFRVKACKNMPQYFDELETRRMELHSQKWIKVEPKKFSKRDIEYIVDKIAEHT